MCGGQPALAAPSTTRWVLRCCASADACSAAVRRRQHQRLPRLPPSHPAPTGPPAVHLCADHGCGRLPRRCPVAVGQQWALRLVAGCHPRHRSLAAAGRHPPVCCWWYACVLCAMLCHVRYAALCVCARLWAARRRQRHWRGGGRCHQLAAVYLQPALRGETVGEGSPPMLLLQTACRRATPRSRG